MMMSMAQSDKRITAGENVPPPTAPAKDERLERLLEHARKITDLSLKPDYEYATELLEQCVLGDRGNVEYTTVFIDSLRRRYKNNRRGAFMAGLKTRSARKALRIALESAAWADAIKRGIAILKINPWDTQALTALAAAAQKLGHFENELNLLKTALSVAPKDPTINRLCALALQERRLYDQAVACWHRVEESWPDNIEANRAITFIQTEKMRGIAGYEEEHIIERIRAASGNKGPSKKEISTEEKLEKAIAADPGQAQPYIELAQFYLDKGRFGKAERILAKAYELSGGDPVVKDQWDEAALRSLQYNIAATDDQARKKKLLRRYYLKEAERYKTQCDKNPGNAHLRFELGYRYLLTGRFADAIRELQASLSDPRGKGKGLLALGRCFQQLKQYDLAMKHYQLALDELSRRSAPGQFEAMRLAGKLALAQGQLDVAEDYLVRLAALQYAYKDVPALLERLAQLRAVKEGGNAQTMRSISK